ncbi:hypothetical protein PMIN01_12527 [Paraphaeosphaeria minitans]|uniref:Apple domain-containing protein n=1 Tax=Paraphaeosphaeria minitans TaxID=565426 RepID=A0A9P6G6L4_9PLEO|nr:hypothetical protein PMIN01_12527 [Paraphaeosphaeria minitans]
MYISRSLLASAAFLSFSTQTGARVTQQELDADQGLVVAHGQSKLQNILQRWPLNKVFGKRQEVEAFTDVQCPTDDLYIVILEAAPSPAVQTLCNNLLGIPPATITLSTTAIVTNFTSTTATSTQTIQVSTTVTEIATVTPAALLRRDAHVAAQFAFANAIMSDVIENGANAAALAAATPNRKQEEALSGFGNACSCETVQPLSTTTITRTFLSNEHIIVGKNVLRVLTRYQTKTITATATVAVGLNVTATPLDFAGSGALPSGSGGPEAELPTSGSAGIELASSDTAALSGASTVTVPASITSPASISLVASGSILPVSPPSASGESSAPVVIGIPFECPTNGTGLDKANGLSPQFIVGDLRFEYSVLCDTAVTDSNTLAGIQNVANQTACAAQCSLVNNRSQRQLCQSASFVPNPGASDGQCFLHGSAQNFARQPGSVTVLLTQVSSKSDKCKSVDLVNGPSNATVDTAELVGNVLTEGFSLSTPGLITRSETGGEYKTFWSSGFTDSVGAYHYSWFEVYASSSAWWAAYATSWTCTVKNTPKTIVIPQPVADLTSVFIDVTTIVENGTTTIISGTSTFSATGGAGVVFPTSVAALGTGGNGGFTSAGATETAFATAGAGVNEIPAPTSAFANETAIVIIGTGSQGAASVIVSGSAATFTSIGGGGVISASPVAESNSTAVVSEEVVSEGSAAFTVSGAETGANATVGSGGQGVAQSSGGLGFSIAGALSTGGSTEGSGVIPPSPTNGSVVGTGSVAVPSSNVPSEGVQSPARISTSVFVLPAQHGYDSPTSSAAASLPASSIEVARSSGGAQFSEFGVTATFNLTGGASVIPPLPVGTGASSAAEGVSANSTGISGSSGGAQFSEVEATATLNLTGGASVVPPSPVESGASSALPVNTTAVGTATFSTGGAEVTLAGSTAVILSTGGSGSFGPLPATINGTELPPSQAPSSSPPTGTSSPFVPSNETAPGVNSAEGAQNFTVSGGTAVASASGGFGVSLPSGIAPASGVPVINATASASEGVAVISESGAVSVILSTGASNVIPPASANVSIPAPTAFVSETASGVVPSPSGNSTAPDEEEEEGGSFGAFNFPDESTEGSSEFEVASTGGVPQPSENATLPASVSATPSSSFNGSLPTGTAVFVTSGEIILSSAASGNGIVSPAVNVSATAPLVSLGTASASGAQNISISGGTALVLSTGTGGVVPVSANQTISVPTSQPPSSSTSDTEDEFNNSLRDRTGRPITRTSGTAPLGTAPIVTGVPTLPVNSTATLVGTAPLVSGPIISGSPAPVFNSTFAIGTAPLVSIPIGTGSPETPVNSTATPIGTAPLVTAPVVIESSTPAANSTIPPPPFIPNGGYGVKSSSEVVIVTSASVSVASVSANSSAVFPTASGSVEQPSVIIPALTANLTLLLPTASGSTEQPSVVIPPLSVNLTVILLTASGSVEQPSASVPLLTANSSAIFPTVGGGGEQPSAGVPPVPANRTASSSGSGGFPFVTGEQPSVTLLPLSANSSTVFPTASGSTGPVFSNSEDDRLGRSRSRTSTGLSGLPLATGNVTLSGTAPIPTLNASLPGTAPLTAVPIPLSTGVGLNSTQLSGATGSSFVPVQSAVGPIGSSAAPVISVNASLQTTGPSAVPVQSANITSVPPVTAASGTAPIIPANSTALFPTGTAPPANSTAFLPTGTSGPDFSNSEAPRRGSFSRSAASANSTAFLPTGTAPALNSSAPFGTASGSLPIPLSTGVVPIPLNSSAPIGTGSGLPLIPLSTGTAPSQGIFTIPANSSVPVGTASAPVPLFTAASISIPVVSENVTVSLGTGVVSASPTPLANVTIPLSTGVALNATTPFATGTGASVTPSASLNGTAGCPTPSAVLVPHTIVITTVSYETLLVGPSTCAPTASAGLLGTGLLGLNATLPTGTGIAAASATSPVVTARLYRRTGEVATQQQIDQACADNDNIVINPDFSFEAANTAFGWTTKTDNPAIIFETQNTSGVSQFARVLAAATNQAMTISQPLTLCPGKEYRMSSTNRQGNLMSKCQAAYYIGNDFVYAASPQETFTRRQEFFTAGTTPADVSQDLRVVVTCNGEAGIPAGTNNDGYMNLDIDDVGVQMI